jgi:erythromycin esterase-like protein
LARPALSGSYEGLFHDTGINNFLLTLRGVDALWDVLNQEELIERAIGVIYLPETERSAITSWRASPTSSTR